MLKLIVITVTMLEIFQQCHTFSCPNPKESSMKLTITSRRNQTGHWSAQATLEHGTDVTTEDQVNTAPWVLNFEQSTAHCDRLESVVLTATVVAPPHKAGPGYEFHRGVGYYKLHTTLKNWNEARDTCIQEGAHLVIINSEEESRVLLNMFERIVLDKKVVWAFIGFHDQYVENQYLTVLGEPLNSTGFLRWASPGQPDNAGGSATTPGEDCGSIYRVNGGLNDYGCGGQLYFFCEQELWKFKGQLVMQGSVQCEGSENIADHIEDYLVLGSAT